MANMTYRKTPEHQAKITAALRGRKLSPESVARRTASRQASDGYGAVHGMWRTPTYRIWANMKQRCLNPQNSAFRHYGARGITVCGRWLKFENFLADMGIRPDGLELDRIDNDGNYEPDNCRWTTRSEQVLNRRRPEYYDRPSRVNECGHPEKPHKARGLCGACYVAERRNR